MDTNKTEEKNQNVSYSVFFLEGNILLVQKKMYKIVHPVPPPFFLIKTTKSNFILINLHS